MMRLLDLFEEGDGAPQDIDPNTPYGVVDKQTGKIVYRTIYANRKRARSFADRLDNNYGAYRYQPTILK